MKQEVNGVHNSDEKGNPAGGFTEANGIAIRWQNGPLGRGEDRKAPNGAFVEGVIAAAVNRLEYYQASKFKCQENADAIAHLGLALERLESRTKLREKQQVEGTHAVHA